MNPLEALQSYAFVTGSSPPEVLQHFLSIRLDSTKAALTILSPDSRTMLHVIRSIRSTVSEVTTLFPFTFQRTINELKSTSLLCHEDLRMNLYRRRANIEIWINPGLRKFMIWTKSELLDNSKVELLLNSWTNQVENILMDNVERLFIDIQELQILCTLREEIISLFSETEENSTPFEERLNIILVNELAKQMTRFMRDRVKKIHELENSAKELISRFKGNQPSKKLLILVNDIAVSVWDPIASKQLKVEQILSLKTAQERPLLKPFATQYSAVMGEIYAGEVILSQLEVASERQQLAAQDISTVLTTHKQTLAEEIKSCSEVFENILNEILGTESQDESTGLIAERVKLIIAAQVVCWFRLISIIRNPPSSIDKAYLVDSFAAEAQTKAQNYMSRDIATKIASLAKQLLSSRSWTGNVPEQSLWEGLSTAKLG